jgi:hypothetical protein
MKRTSSPPDERPTTAQLRADIDGGRTGDKVGGFDPAAAPLGTDDEAAGTPPSPEVIAQARALEGRRQNTARANAATPDLAPAGQQSGRWPWIALGLCGALAIAAILILFVQ